jgi:lipopolysaccharide export system protein LptA
VISQGDMRLAAASVVIVYDEAAGEIDRMEAKGGVTLVSAADAAEAQNAVYMVREAKLRLTGAVLLTQGLNALASDEMVVDLENGTAQILGRVRTVLNPSRQD